MTSQVSSTKNDIEHVKRVDTLIRRRKKVLFLLSEWFLLEEVTNDLIK